MAVRSSKYRHVYGDPTRKDKCFDNIRLTKNAFDANLVKSNGKYVSLNWEASGGGSFAVVPVSEQGKLPDRFPLFDGHKGPVLDTDWNPFDDEMVVSASDDGTIGIWRVPDNFTVHEDFAGNLDACKDIAPLKFLAGHGKKVGHVGFNPVAENVLASSSLDNTVKVWNIDTEKLLFTLQHPSFVTSFCWNFDGTKIATVAKDRKLRIWDVRKEKVISEGKGHAGAKGSRVVWLGDSDRVMTTGFSLVSDREMALWDANNISKGPIGGFRPLDPSSGIVIPHYDPMTSVVYLGGRGDGKIVYFEFADDTLYELFAYSSTSPQRGLGWVPNRSLDPHAHEVARVYKVHEGMIEPISFKIPLKNEGFLGNVYTVCESTKPALSANEWASGKTSRPLVFEWRDVYDGKSVEPKEAGKNATRSSTADKKATPEAKKMQKESSSEPTKASATKHTTTIAKGSSSSSSTTTTTKASTTEVNALSKAEKQDSYDVLHSDNVKSFLSKNTQEEEEESEPESDWSEQKKETPTAEQLNNVVEKKESKDAPKSAAAKESPKDSTKEAPKETPKAAESKETPKAAEPKETSKAAPKDSPKKASPKEESSKNVFKDTSKETPSDASKKTTKDTSKETSTKTSSETAPKTEETKFDIILKKLDELSARVESLERKCK